MNCPNCSAADTRVIDSRPSSQGATLRRRRQCDSCEHRFTTYERVAENPLVVVKGDGRREEFSLDKLRSGLRKACNKRSVSTDAIDEAAESIERELRNESGSEIGTNIIGEKVMERLYHLDEVAFVRFASVYQRFDDVKRFAQLLDRMSKRNRKRNSKTGAVKARSSKK